MAIDTTNLDAIDLAGAIEGGLVKEDVMDRIYEIDPDDRPFCDAIGTDDSDNILKEFTGEILEAPNPNNAYIDGQSLADINDSVIGNRYGNYHQTMVKVVRVSNRGRVVNSIGTSDQMIWQLSRRQKALRHDEEAGMLGINGAQAGNGDKTDANAGPGLMAGMASCLRTNTYRGANGADAALSGTTGGYPVTGTVPPTDPDEWIGITPGNKRGITEDMIKTATRDCYDAGGNPSLLISVPTLIETISDFLFTSSARVATIQSEVSQGNRTDNSTGGGRSGSGVTAQGAVNLYVTNFGTLELVPDRFQQTYTAADTGDVCNVFIVDPAWFSKSYLQGYQTKELSRDGLGDNSYIDVDVTLCFMAEHSSALIADITPDTAMVNA